MYLVLCAVVVTAGCEAPQSTWNAAPVTMQGDRFDVQLAPECWGGSYGCVGFHLTINNKTEDDIEIDWNKTLFIRQGQTAGGFTFEGIAYRDRNEPKNPDVVFAGSSWSKLIVPSVLVQWTGRSWIHNPMPAGDNGVYLHLRMGGEEVVQRVTLAMSRQ